LRRKNGSILHSHATRGFTLIELSIVLVIIGLIIGGIMVGRDLIRAAQLKRTIREVEMLNTAVNTFQVKYNCLPGDCVNATQFWGAAPTCPPTLWTQNNTTSPATCNGDGDGQIENSEPFAFFAQLSNAGLINQLISTGNCCGVFTALPGLAVTAYPSAVYGNSNAGYNVVYNNSEYIVRRDKVRISSGCNSHPANSVAPAGSYRSGGGGNEAAGAFEKTGRSSDSASSQAVTRVNVEQASKDLTWKPTRLYIGEGRSRWGNEAYAS
jgi:prepilin-type N-terminal cleavage/methylation domain-containing protein